MVFCIVRFEGDLLVGFSSTLLRTCARHTSWGTFKQNDHSLLGSVRVDRIH